MRASSSRSGFTLIELMIVVAIISILAAIAIPSYVKMAAKSRQTEAKEGLNGIFTLEKSYFSEKNSYGDIAQIGFVADGDGRYSFCVGDPSVSGSCIQAAVDPVGVGAASGGADGGAAGGGGGAGTGINGPTSMAPQPVSGDLGNRCDDCSPPPAGDDTSTPAPSSGGGGVVAGNPHADGTTFEADAYGRISNASSIDTWSIDNRKMLLNVSVGY